MNIELTQDQVELLRDVLDEQMLYVKQGHDVPYRAHVLRSLTVIRNKLNNGMDALALKDYASDFLARGRPLK